MTSSEQDNDSITLPPPTDEEMLAMALQFVFTDPSGETIRVERRSHPDYHDWVAVNEAKFLLNHAGQWEWKPIFDRSDEDFQYHTGFDNARAAIVAARKALAIANMMILDTTG